MRLHVYLTFHGNGRAAIEHYAAIFGTEVEMAQSFAEMPPDPDMPPLSDVMKGRLMHARIRIGATELMVSDSWDEYGKDAHDGVSVVVDCADIAEAERVFAALAEGGRVTLPFGPTFWAAGFGTCEDRFGVSWMVNVDAPAP